MHFALIVNQEIFTVKIIFASCLGGENQMSLKIFCHFAKWQKQNPQNFTVRKFSDAKIPRLRY